MLCIDEKHIPGHKESYFSKPYASNDRLVSTPCCHASFQASFHAYNAMLTEERPLASPALPESPSSPYLTHPPQFESLSESDMVSLATSKHNKGTHVVQFLLQDRKHVLLDHQSLIIELFDNE